MFTLGLYFYVVLYFHLELRKKTGDHFTDILWVKIIIIIIVVPKNATSQEMEKTTYF